jgi:hypothetical protein
MRDIRLVVTPLPKNAVRNWLICVKQVVLTIAQGTYHQAYWKYKIGSILVSTGQREKKYLPTAIPMVEETMIPVDKLTTTAPKSKKQNMR